MDNAKPAICVFCGSSFGDDPAFRAAARELGRGIAEMGASMVFGGGVPGLMGETARAAREAGAPVEGILPDFLRAVEPPLTHGETTEIVPDLFVRKQKMIARADAFAVLPGGLGTYDEFFEVLTAAQLGVHAKPIVVINTGGYFDALHALVKDCIARGFARDTALKLYRMAPGVTQALEMLRHGLAPSR
jgi:uncharacterized protein (TIGR00730 family)